MISRPLHSACFQKHVHTLKQSWLQNTLGSFGSFSSMHFGHCSFAGCPQLAATERFLGVRMDRGFVMMSKYKRAYRWHESWDVSRVSSVAPMDSASQNQVQLAVQSTLQQRDHHL
jgi:hypothetical protein